MIILIIIEQFHPDILALSLKWLIVMDLRQARLVLLSNGYYLQVSIILISLWNIGDSCCHGLSAARWPFQLLDFSPVVTVWPGLSPLKRSCTRKSSEGFVKVIHTYSFLRESCSFPYINRFKFPFVLNGDFHEKQALRLSVSHLLWECPPVAKDKGIICTFRSENGGF